LPQTAVSSNPYGDSVFIVHKPEGEGPATVAKRFVTTGEVRGDQVAITKGLKPGVTVVTSGQLKLQEGAAIKVNNEVQPADDPSPTPANR
ncbi:MAG TPA: efflux transporter periplasmic adaptor subunit, partial [Gammaproteobacteria bacterium]|nr:efflux transporter periplasmic adaptor subunit [Gammaproteobacteria bacterium]